MWAERYLRRYKRPAAGCMAAVILVLTAAGSARAGEPSPAVDETMYVNLDYYGEKTDVSVVKGCFLTGDETFTDYGDYEKVVNMTDGRQPQVDGDRVVWETGGETGRFYYEGVMDPDGVELPWTFDLSYKLNGVAKKAEDLKGASGLVEIHVKAEPNEQADEYYRNNMILSVIVPVDMEKCYSLDAPGAQIQTLGTEKAAVFGALPGAEGDFTVRIGTDSYESIGILMMMVPGRLEDLNRIKDLKEAKDTWTEDGERMYESVDRVLEVLESMKGDAVRMKSGIESLDRAREIVSENRASLESSASAALGDLEQMTVWTAALVPYLQTARQAVTDINEDTDRMSSTMYQLEEELDDLYARMGGLRDNLNTIAGAVPTISPEEKAAVLEQIRQDADQAKAVVDRIRGILEQMNGWKEDARERWEELEESLSYAGSGHRDSLATPSEEPYWIPEEGAEEEYERMSGDLDLLAANGYLEEVEEMLDRLSGILGSTQAVEGTASAVIDGINEALATAEDTVRDTAKVLSSLRGADEQIVYLLDDMRELIATVDGYVPAMMESLRSTEDLMTGLSRSLDSTHGFLSAADSTLKAAGDSLDQGARESLQGIRDLLEKSLQMLDDTAEVRAAAADMKETLDEQLDRFEEENRFLNMDPEAEMVSFTSEKNPEPESLQIIVRTQEISKDSLSTDISDEEGAAAADEGPFRRMWNVIVKIFRSVVDIFKNR